MQVPSSRHRRALVALAALLVGLALPLLASATTVGVSAAAPVESTADVALDRLAPMVTAPAVRASPVPTPVALPVIVLAALLLAALTGPASRSRRPLAWTLLRPDRVTAARGGSLSIAWRAPPTVR